ncbi:MAG: hypothetical protein ACTS41_01640 [Candidatus Hodgkinia cicadicola]
MLTLSAAYFGGRKHTLTHFRLTAVKPFGGSSEVVPTKSSIEVYVSSNFTI